MGITPGLLQRRSRTFGCELTAETVAHLAGPARWINGQVVYANGGIV
ncbi:hypothetical protein [Rhodococcus sp. 15-649-2-2]|nr:hypothetical protein [Rhodococcus sp. 15-649-2-2]